MKGHSSGPVEGLKKYYSDISAQALRAKKIFAIMVILSLAASVIFRDITCVYFAGFQMLGFLIVCARQEKGDWPG